MILPQISRERRNKSRRRDPSEQQVDAVEVPLSASALYNAIRVQTKNAHCEQVIFHPTLLPETHAVALDEYPFLLAIMTALRIMTKYTLDATIHVNLTEAGGRLELTLHTAPSAPDMLRKAFVRYNDLLVDVLINTAIDADLLMRRGEFFLRFSVPVCEIDAKDLRAQDVIIAALVARALKEARIAVV